MKQELKRIETTLQQLTQRQSGASYGSQFRSRLLVPTFPRRLGDRASTSQIVNSQTVNSSQTVAPVTAIAKHSDALATVSAVVVAPQPSFAPSIPSSSVRRSPLPPLLTKLAEVGTPTLPRFKAPTFTSHRNAPNPALAMSLLKELQTTVAGWQGELRQVLRQIQDLYLEGPIVDGWLESYAQNNEATPAFHRADASCLADYIEKMRNVPLGQPHPEPLSSLSLNADIKALDDAAGYRLCGLNQDGQLWFRHCPAAQLPAVSLAIARYQRLRHLLARKQSLEINLSKLAETLVMVHGNIAKAEAI